MGDIKIKSENQSGGITAQNVNSPNAGLAVNNTPPQESQSRRIFWWIFGMAGLIGVIVAIIALFK
jgi:hypothetical protein